MKDFIIFIILITFAACATQQYTIEGQAGEKKIIKGNLNWKEFQKHAAWPDYDADDYTTDKETLTNLKKGIDNYRPRFVLFAATWCPDCQSELPKIFKIFREMNVSADFIEIVAVDKDKKDLKGWSEEMNIEKVPTLVIFTEGKEKGRIVEFPRVNWEKDMMNIILGME